MTLLKRLMVLGYYYFTIACIFLARSLLTMHWRPSTLKGLPLVLKRTRWRLEQ
jgi:hypothetical protein